jgi:hypothetical protein
VSKVAINVNYRGRYVIILLVVYGLSLKLAALNINHVDINCLGVMGAEDIDMVGSWGFGLFTFSKGDGHERQEMPSVCLPISCWPLITKVAWSSG